jgi:hypothetical protein
LLSGCSNTAWQLGAGQPHVNSNVQVHAGSGVATVFGLTMLAAGAYEAARSGFVFSSNAIPEMAPDRKVSEQDCSKPLDYTLGNIRCK